MRNATPRACARTTGQRKTATKPNGPRSTSPARPVTVRGRATCSGLTRSRVTTPIQQGVWWCGFVTRTAARGRWIRRPASRNAPCRVRHRRSSRPARAAIRAGRCCTSPMCTGGRSVTRTGCRCSRTGSTTRTVRYGTRCTSTAPSCRAGCSAQGSPAATATTRTACASRHPATGSASAAIWRRSTTRRRTITTRAGRLPPRASSATRRRACTWWWTGGGTTASACRAPICHRRSARPTPAPSATRTRATPGRQRRSPGGTGPTVAPARRGWCRR